MVGRYSALPHLEGFVVGRSVVGSGGTGDWSDKVPYVSGVGEVGVGVRREVLWRWPSSSPARINASLELGGLAGGAVILGYHRGDGGGRFLDHLDPGVETWFSSTSISN